MNHEGMGEPLYRKEIASCFDRWIHVMHVDKVKFNPAFISTKHGKGLFGMSQHMGRFVVSTTTMHQDLANNQQIKVRPRFLY